MSNFCEFFDNKILKNGGDYLTKQKRKEDKFDIPQYEIEALARAFLPAVLNYYRTEEGKKEIEKWKKQCAEKIKK